MGNNRGDQPEFIDHIRITVTETRNLNTLGIKNTFIVQTDAHYYKIVEMIKQF